MIQAYQSYTVKALIPYLFQNNVALEFGIFDCFLYLCTRQRASKQAVVQSRVLFQAIYSRTLN